MKIERPSNLTPGAGRAARKASGGQGFSVSDDSGTSGTARAGASGSAAGVAGLDALLALQAEQETDRANREPRQRAMRRGRRILDLLEDLKIGLLGGEVSANKLHALNQAVESERDAVTDPGLDAVLKEIDLRAQVELAKIERARGILDL